jgi:hypothetical protein
VEKNQNINELVIMLGIYNIYQNWEELPKRKSTPKKTESIVKPVEMTGAPSLLVSQLGDRLAEEDTAAGDDDDDLDLDALFAEDPLYEEDKEAAGPESGGAASDEETDELLYNAIEDFRWLLIKAPARGVHFLVVLSQFSEYKELKWPEKMFRHLVYQWLAKEELADIIGFGRSARIPGGAVRYVSKKDAFSLRPYLWPGLIINGWTMDEAGNAVEAGDEDDEFI